MKIEINFEYAIILSYVNNHSTFWGVKNKKKTI